jgi:hypothetical protein
MVSERTALIKLLSGLIVRRATVHLYPLELDEADKPDLVRRLTVHETTAKPSESDAVSNAEDGAKMEREKVERERTTHQQRENVKRRSERKIKNKKIDPNFVYEREMDDLLSSDMSPEREPGSEAHRKAFRGHWFRPGTSLLIILLLIVSSMSAATVERWRYRGFIGRNLIAVNTNYTFPHILALPFKCVYLRDKETFVRTVSDQNGHFLKTAISMVEPHPIERLKSVATREEARTSNYCMATEIEHTRAAHVVVARRDFLRLSASSTRGEE